MTTITKSLLDINAESMKSAEKSITNFVTGRNLVLDGKLDLSSPLNFPSKKKTKGFKKLLERIIERASMKNISIFLRYYSKFSNTAQVKIDHSPKEKQIQEARKAYIEARKTAIEMYAKYKEEKGDFYKSISSKV